MMRFTVFILLGLSIATTSSGQSLLTLANGSAEGKSNFHEELSEAAEISGAVFAGVQVRSTDPEKIDLNAYLPHSWSGGQMCLRIISVDGLYEAVNTYDITSSGSGIAPIPYPTAYQDRLAAESEDGIAIRATRGGCDTGASKESTVAFWNASKVEVLTLLINSFRADQVFVYISDAGTPIRCAPVTQQNRTAYDTVCHLSGLPETGALHVDVFRVKKGISTQEESIKIYLPE